MSAERPLRRLAPLALVAALLAVRAAPTAQACGPWLAGQPIGEPERFLLGAVELRFAEAAREIAGRSGGLLPVTPARDAVERQELVDALLARGITGGRALGVLGALVVARATIARGGRLGPLPADMPREFALYLEAAAGDWATRGEKAREILALPAAERRQRTVWAAYLLYRKGDRDLDWGAETRRLAAAGFPDPLRLAAATFTRERQRAEDDVTYANALLGALALGDDDANHDLLAWAHDAVHSPDLLSLGQVARHPRLRALISARLLAVPVESRGPETEEEEATWLAVLADLPTPQNQRIEGAELASAIAYRRGDLKATRRWLALADPTRPMAARIAAKLALRAGRLPVAEALLVRAAEAPGSSTNTTGGFADVDVPAFPSPAVELGMILLARGKAPAALEAFLVAGDWMSAAYVAERVLTVAELRTYVDALPVPAREPACQGAKRSNDYSVEDRDPAPRFCGWPDGDGSGDGTSRVPVSRGAGGQTVAAVREMDLWQLRFLLARALVREGELATARRYMPALGLPILDAYAAALAQGRDAKLTPAMRGAALARAARLLRRFGMELVGTELAPDWHVWEGDYSADDVAPARLALPAARGGAGRAERARLTRPFPTRRFHYRWLASALAWEAAQLLPVDDQATRETRAQILCFGGQWIILHDQAGARRFWRALTSEHADSAVYARSGSLFEDCLAPGELPVLP